MQYEGDGKVERPDEIMLERWKTLISWMLVGVREEGYCIGGILGKKKEADVRGADTAVRV